MKKIYALISTLALLLSSGIVAAQGCEDPIVQIFSGDSDGNSMVCAGEPFTLRVTNMSCTNPGDYYFEWTGFGSDETIDGNPQISIPAQTNGTASPNEITISLVIWDDVDDDMDTANDTIIGTDDITLEILPEMSVSIGIASGSEPLCLGNDISLIATVEGGGGAPFGSISWSGDVSGSQLSVIDNNVNQTSPSYSISVTDQDGCTATDSNNGISINPLPQPVVTGSAIYCTDDELELDVSSGGTITDCEWDVVSGEINPSASADDCMLTIPSVTTDDTNDYFVTITDDNGCEGVSSQFDVEVFELEIEISADLSEVCSNAGNVALDLDVISGAPLTTEQLTANGVDIDVETAEFDPEVGNTGTFTIVYSATNPGCSASASTTIEVLPIPDVSISGDIPTVCRNNSSIDLSDFISPAGGVFSSTDVTLPGDGILDPVEYAAGAIDFTYEFQAANSCINSVNGTLVVDPELIAEMEESFSICQGFETNLGVNPTGGSGSGYSFSWSNPGGLDNPNSQSPELLATLAEGSYDFTLTLTDNNGCEASGEQSVLVAAQPSVTITHVPASFCDNESLVMTANVEGGTGALQYFWENESGTTQPNTFETGPIVGSREISVEIVYPDFAQTGCQTTNFDTLVSASPSPNPSILSIPESNSICSNSASVFFAADKQNGTELFWSLGSVNQFVDSTREEGNAFYVYWGDDLAGSESIILQEIYPGSCDTTVSIDVTFNDSQGISPSEIVLSPLNGILYYNQSDLCYRWGTLNPNPNESINEPYINYNLPENHYQSLVVGELDTTLTYFCQVWLPGDCEDLDSPCSTTIVYQPKSNTSAPLPPEEKVDFKVFPNPNTGNFNFKMGDLIADRTYKWELRNTIGQIIDSGGFVPSGGDHTESLSIRNRAQGIYLLTISDGVNILKVSRVSIQN